MEILRSARLRPLRRQDSRYEASWSVRARLEAGKTRHPVETGRRRESSFFLKIQWSRPDLVAVSANSRAGLRDDRTKHNSDAPVHTESAWTVLAPEPEGASADNKGGSGCAGHPPPWPPWLGMTVTSLEPTPTAPPPPIFFLSRPRCSVAGARASVSDRGHTRLAHEKTL
jgi:hypothetical protein